MVTSTDPVPEDAEASVLQGLLLLSGSISTSPFGQRPQLRLSLSTAQWGCTVSEKGGNRTDPTAAAGPSRHVPGGARVLSSGSRERNGELDYRVY